MSFQRTLFSFSKSQTLPFDRKLLRCENHIAAIISLLWWWVYCVKDTFYMMFSTEGWWGWGLSRGWFSGAGPGASRGIRLELWKLLHRLHYSFWKVQCKLKITGMYKLYATQGQSLTDAVFCMFSCYRVTTNHRVQFRWSSLFSLKTYSY